jgi:hypothetical protein
VHALLAKQIRVFFVTHLYHFAHTFFIERPDRCTFLRAVRRSDGTRSFKLASGAPLQTSYGQDLCRAIFGDGENRTEGAAQRTDNAATV